MFIKFYEGLDPLEMSYGRFQNLYDLISDVMSEFSPKSSLQLALMEKEAEIKEYQRTRKKKK